MTLRQYLSIMVISSILCWTAWVIVIMNIDPFQSDWFGFAFFYMTLFFSLLGAISILSFLVYCFLFRNELSMFRYVKKSFRDSFIISIVLLILLFLEGNQLLNKWNLGILVLFLIFIFSFWFSTKRRESKPIISNQPPFSI